MNAEKRVATATINISSMAITANAAAWATPSVAPDASEIDTNVAIMIAICIQIVATSPRYLPSRNSARERGFERIV